MVQIDNVKMWESLIRISKEGDNLIGDREIGLALKDQGLEYKDGKIVSKEEIKGNQREVSPNPSELTEFEKVLSDMLDEYGSDPDRMKDRIIEKYKNKIRQQIASEIDVDAMAEVKQYNIDAYGLLNYRRGIEDTIKKIKEG